jgi:hypothetical protein
MTEGICFFAYNNEQIDYVKLATIAASYAKLKLNKPVCLITDAGSYAWLQQSQPESLIDACFDHIVLTDDEMKKNMRTHNDSPWTNFHAQFNNSNKHKVFEYTPFDKTILLDIDYILKTDFLNMAFNYEGVAMYSNAINIRNDKPHLYERQLYDVGIPMWWSTVVYFDKSEESKIFFDTWAHVADNYDFYQYLYNFPGKLFRTDYCTSIAIHIMNGMIPGDAVHDFGGLPMQNMSQKDDITEVINLNEWVCVANDTIEDWNDIAVRHSNHDVHVMNKRSLDRMGDRLLELLYE